MALLQGLWVHEHGHQQVEYWLQLNYPCLAQTFSKMFGYGLLYMPLVMRVAY